MPKHSKEFIILNNLRSKQSVEKIQPVLSKFLAKTGTRKLVPGPFVSGKN